MQEITVNIAEKFIPQAHNITSHFEAHGYTLYAVGGSVRDTIIQNQLPHTTASKLIGDVDFTTNALPEDIMRICKKTIPTGIVHGTVTVLWKGAQFEITTHRTDNEYTNYRHPNAVSFTTSLEEDLVRRDFTINALALHLSTNTLYDPCHGIQDIKQKIIRCIGSPDTRFTEDALRMLRCLRFSSTLEFTIEEETFCSITKQSHLIKKISRERIAIELKKILLSPHPEKGYKLLTVSCLYTHIFSLPFLSSNSIFLTYCQDTYNLLACVKNMEQRIADMQNKHKEIIVHAALFYKCKDYKIVQELCKSLRLSNTVTRGVMSIIRSRNINIHKKKKNTCTRLRMLIILIGIEYIKTTLAFSVLEELAYNNNFLPSMLYYKKLIKIFLEENVVAQPADLQIDGTKIAKEKNRPSGKWLGNMKKTLMRFVCVYPQKNNANDLLEYATKLRSVS